MNGAGDYKGLRRAVLHIPNPRRAITRPRDEESPVRRESYREGHLGVTLESVADSPLGDVPNLERQKLFYVEHLP